MRKIATAALTLIFVTFICTIDVLSQKIELYYSSSPQVDFGYAELEKVFGPENIQNHSLDAFMQSKAAIKVVLMTLSEASLTKDFLKTHSEKARNISPEGFSLFVDQKKNGKVIYIIGSDEPGVMYGTLELAEQIKLKGLDGVAETKQNPYMKERGTKFNIPLDVRTPSYTDVCDAAQKNIANMWDIEFWKEYIDNLARNRYNLISLWNLHPFPSMVKVAEYPDVALNDVQRSTVKWNEFYPLEGLGFCTPEIINNVETVKKISIDEKIEFWRSVMRYGKERNVSFFIVTWNVFVYGAEGKYGITDDYKNPVTIDYFRKSVKQMLLTYPDLKGIGLTTGENFGKATTIEKEDWAFNTFGLGVLDASKELPGRKITFIHRQHQTGALDIADKFKPLIDNKDINFIFSFKYAQAHVFSSTTQPFCNNFVKEIKSRGDLKTIWTLRNDDNFIYRWGSPDFVREFIKNIPYDVSEGFYYGSDQWIWGREFLSKDPENSGQLEIEKHWYHWMLWGRLGYNPEIKNDLFKSMLASRFPGVSAEKLLNAWQDASMIYPITTGFHWGALDFQWYIESSKSLKGFAQNETGFHDVNRFITLRPHPGTKNQSIPAYILMLKSGGATDSITPVQVSQMLHEHADRALAALEDMEAGGNAELGYTLEDIRAMAYLGKYYAHKIMGAVELQKYRVFDTKKKENQVAAVEELTRAGIYFKMYIEVSKKSYKNPFWTNRVGYVDWDKLYRWVMDDLTIAKGAI